MQENKVTKQKIGKLTESYPNVLNLAADPKQVLYGTYNTNEYNHFSDLGAWHGYYLPKQGEDRLLGGFAGPVIIAEEYPVNLSRAISRIKIVDEAGKEYQLKDARQKGVSYPGRLVQNYDMDEIALTLELVFATNRTALICATIENKTQQQKQMNLFSEIFSDFDSVPVFPFSALKGDGKEEILSYLESKIDEYSIEEEM